MMILSISSQKFLLFKPLLVKSNSYIFFWRLISFCIMDMVEGNEPFKKLLTQGMVLKDGAKMSKSKGNTVDPQSYIEKYGADTVRLYMMFTAPPEQSLEWSESSVEGASRFIKKVYNLVIDKTFISIKESNQFSKEEINLRRKTHTTLKKVTNDFESRFSFNTAIASIMELLNAIPEDFKKINAPYSKKFCLNESIIIILKTLGDVLCIIEAMKMMNEIKSDFSGKIVSINLEDGEPVEFGQSIITIN